MTQTSEADRLVTKAEACKLLGIRHTTFYKLINRGELTAIDVSGAPKRLIGQPGPRRSLRVALSEIEAFKTRHEITTS
jgi:excisionase family DNA binding protein